MLAHDWTMLPSCDNSLGSRTGPSTATRYTAVMHTAPIFITTSFSAEISVRPTPSLPRLSIVLSATLEVSCSLCPLGLTLLCSLRVAVSLGSREVGRKHHGIPAQEMLDEHVAEIDPAGHHPEDSVAPQVLWIPDLVTGDKAWLARFRPPSRPTQALIACAQKQVIAEVKERSVTPEIHTLPLVEFLSFNDWAELIYLYRHRRNEFVDTLNRMARATIVVDEAMKVEDRTINTSTIDAEVKFVGIWGADSQFHKERVVRGVVIADEVALEDDEDEMTEEEKEYMRKKEVEVARTKACLMTNTKKSFTDARRNAFLPFASPRWVETMSTAFSGKIWSLETFNYLAPIDQRGYKLLASLTQDEMKSAFERALDMNTPPPEVKFPFSGDGTFLPPISSMDGNKCSLPRPNVLIKGNKPPQNPSAFAELKRVWNLGRPYLKCRCCSEGKADCGTGPAWFDHLIWFLLYNLDVLYPDAPTPRAKVSSLIKCLSTCWKPLMLTSLSFGCVREVMMLLAKKIVANPSLTIDSVLVGVNGADRKAFKECAKLLLMSMQGILINGPSGRKWWVKLDSKDGPARKFVHIHYVGRQLEGFDPKKIFESVVSRFVNVHILTVFLSIVYGWTYDEPINKK
ncbi:hypothetical protein CBR_g48872 [Chara braunii]|uniref:Uncharacterized protein n=1 Tax=Chara braunii TaxID=69332 RepID=A0A388M3L4_CHABU|nr:hypothetical protein CBR_g48872 [Chara braunii]|eukprot:GBG89164.1 hypothetical protein CBR_g48872 [Chara braunii]